MNEGTENLEVVEESPLQEDTLTPAIDPEQEEYQKIVLSYEGNHYKAIFEYCYKKNIPYVDEIANMLLKTNDDSVYAKMPGVYIDTVKADYRFNELDFFKQLKQNNFEKIYSEDLSLLSLSEDDKQNRLACLDIIGYDPFKDDLPSDRSQLYRDLAGMLTDNMRKDIAKQKACLNIVRSYQNIETYQRKISDITNSGQVDDDTQKQLDSYMKVIANIQASINQTAEKNNFTVKGIGSNGKGMLSDVMQQIEEKGIDEGITNFYDIATSKSIEEVAAISFKAQLNQVNLSKTDYADILTNQCEIVREAQRKAKDAIEAARLAKEKLTKQGLLIELEKEYRKKGIKEEEIQEFIDREYKMFDGKD